jgi:predicted hotdog family 3-hydroxylacyl-ACP dehydratase
MSRIGYAEIARMIPHGGAMCLLDEVLHWDAESVQCRSTRFAAAENPLRRADGRFGAACGIEIAAQALAVHGRLTAPDSGPPTPGWLVGLRDVVLSAPYLGDAALWIEATRLAGDARGASYNFAVSQAGATMLTGRATVMFAP